MTARGLPLSHSPEQSPTQGSARRIEVSNQDISRFRSIVSAPIKGIAKGALNLVDLASWLSDPTNVLYGKYLKPGFQKAEEAIERNIPTRPEFLESALERGGKLVPAALLATATGGTSALGALGTSAAGGFAGQAVEEAGGGPILQTLAEAGPSIVPSLARKLIPATADQKRILDLGRKFGMTEEQLAPLMPEAGKRRFFGKFAFAGEKTGEKLGQTKKGIQNIYQILEGSPQAKQFVSPRDLNRFSQEMNRLGQKMPHNIRSQLVNDAKDLVRSAQAKGGVSGEDLMNFYHDISNRYNLGRTQLELFKVPVRDALKSLDPSLAHDFETVNKMYQKSIQIGRVLKPSEYEHLISLGEAYELGASVANLDPSRLQRLLGIVGFRKFSEQMLTNPRLQNLIKKTQDAVMKNRLPLIKKFGEQILSEFKEEEDQSE